MAKVTIQSMAKELGLSRNTVSMALKGNCLVAPHTRDMVLKYAVKAGYINGEPEENVALEKVPEKCTQHHIMILRKLDVAVFWDKVINGISEEASGHHCQTKVAVVTEEDERLLRLPLGLDEDIRAVFFIKFLNRDYIRRIKEKGILVFLLDDLKNPGGEPLGDVVKTEGVNDSALLTRHLLSQGMRRIGFLNENSGIYETMYDRFDGYRYAMEQMKSEADPSIVQPDVKGEFFYSLQTFEKVVESYAVMPEAVVCGNDEIAKYLTQALRRKGWRVPEDVAVTGFDNDEEGMPDPFFTTVHVDAKWLGRRLVQCFLWRVENPDAPYEKIVVSGKVIIRKSSIRSPAQ